MPFTGMVGLECTYPANFEPAALGCMAPMPKRSPMAVNARKQVIGPLTIPRDPPGFFSRLSNRARQHA